MYKTNPNSYTTDNAVQTDASILPELTSLGTHLEELSTKHWTTLKCMREGVMQTASKFCGVLHDLIALKNVACRLPGMDFAAGGLPVDIVLVTSKLHRASALLIRQLGTFFDIVFSEGVADELYHFTEIRLTKKTLAESTKELQIATKQVENLKERVKTLEAREEQLNQALENIELSNTGLEVRSATLEDQMALLFEQLADDYIYYNEDQLRCVAGDTKLHEKLAPVRSAFSHSIDAVQHRLRFFQDLLSEISLDSVQLKDGNDSTDITATGTTTKGKDKSKLKSLEVHLHHLTSRFSAVREGLQQTARELHTALIDKKRIVSFSVQHLKSYEQQSSKLQSARARLFDLRKSLAIFNSSFRKAYPNGTLTSIENDKIIHYTRCIDGNNDVSVCDVRMSDLYAQLDCVKDDTSKATEIISTTDEHRHLMKTVALSIPSGQKKPKNQPKKIRLQVKEVTDALLGSPDQSTATEGKQIDDSQLATRDDVLNLKSEYCAKVAFIREVYEDRIRSLEAKVDMLVKKLVAGTGEVSGTTDKDMSISTKRKWLSKKKELLENGEIDRREALLTSLRAIEDNEDCFDKNKIQSPVSDTNSVSFADDID